MLQLCFLMVPLLISNMAAGNVAICYGLKGKNINVVTACASGTNAIGEATAKKMNDFRVVIWSLHGVYGAGKDMDETFGLIETVEKAAQIYMLTAHLPRLNTIKDEDMLQLVELFKVDCKREFLNLKK